MELLNFLFSVDLSNYQNRKEFISDLQKKYLIDDNLYYKIIIYNEDQVIKIGISETLKDTLVYDEMIYNEAKIRGLDIFFAELKKIGTFKQYTQHGIYQQPFLDNELNAIKINNIIDFWIDNFGIEKIIELFNFLEEFQIFDIKIRNFGFNKNLNNYQLFDFQPNTGPQERFLEGKNYLYSKITQKEE